MSRLTLRLLYWAPRILTIAFALFIALFALDVFNEVHGFWTVLLALGMHLLPAFAVIAVLVAAWYREWIGAVAYAILAFVYAYLVLPRHWNWFACIGTPLLVMAALFLAGWFERAKIRTAH